MIDPFLFQLFEHIHNLIFDTGLRTSRKRKNFGKISAALSALAPVSIPAASSQSSPSQPPRFPQRWCFQLLSLDSIRPENLVFGLQGVFFGNSRWTFLSSVPEEKLSSGKLRLVRADRISGAQSDPLMESVPLTSQQRRETV